ncbi:sugar O-acetyltransferase [Lipingzhangella sp. LS1_29]|uniref:Sugar O-acetyltransferase n=1 Tax=Lipingzhangella rawalii TaxID=2055835 RepID=A0ABU2H7R1_9ACTN|nr:sugar O-acetyltransferase [Lipingzhangella rawalii]MDS1270879.1 sugar O-acetyltransferase [Lipingzhangella rawalii]
MPSQKQRMLAGQPYIANDPELEADARRAAELNELFNAVSATEPQRRREVLAALLGKLGAGAEIRSPLHVDYGYNIRVGEGVFVNVGAVLLDVAPIVIGDDVQLGPYVQLLTATHPVEPVARRAKWESGQPITLGENVWLGGGAVVCPGVTVGANTVVGAGAVVTANLPANVVAVGNPARITREI